MSHIVVGSHIKQVMLHIAPHICHCALSFTICKASSLTSHVHQLSYVPHRVQTYICVWLLVASRLASPPSSSGQAMSPTYRRPTLCRTSFHILWFVNRLNMCGDIAYTSTFFGLSQPRCVRFVVNAIIGEVTLVALHPTVGGPPTRQSYCRSLVMQSRSIEV